MYITHNNISRITLTEHHFISGQQKTLRVCGILSYNGGTSSLLELKNGIDYSLRFGKPIF